MADARLGQAEALLRGGRASDAVPLLTAVLATVGATAAECRTALQLRAQAREALGDLPGAIADLEHAIQRHPQDARLHNALGILLRRQGRRRPARSSRCRSRSDSTRRTRARGTTSPTRCAAAGASPRRRSAAATRCGGATRLRARVEQPGRAPASISATRPARAMAFQRSLALRPDLRTLRGACCDRPAARRPRRGDRPLRPRERGEPPATRTRFCRWPARSRSATTWTRRARLCRGAMRATRSSCARAFGERLALPMVYAGCGGASRRRANAMRTGSHALEAEIPALVRGRAFADVIDDLRWTNFLLAYQGEDDRELQARFAAVVARAIDAVAPEWRVPPRRSATRRAACASVSRRRSSRDGTCGRYFRSWITGLDRARFEIFVYNVRRDATPFLQRARAARRTACGRFRARRSSPSAVARRDPRGRARRARLSGARHERVDVRARRAAPGARAVRRLGPSGDDRPRDDRRLLHLCRDGARRRRVALHRAARRASGHRHRLCATARYRRVRRVRATDCPRARRCSSARSRCSRSIPTTTRCSRACWRRRPGPVSCCSKDGTRR